MTDMLSVTENKLGLHVFHKLQKKIVIWHEYFWITLTSNIKNMAPWSKKWNENGFYNYYFFLLNDLKHFQWKYNGFLHIQHLQLVKSNYPYINTSYINCMCIVCILQHLGHCFFCESFCCCCVFNQRPHGGQIFSMLIFYVNIRFTDDGGKKQKNKNNNDCHW